MNKNKIMDIKTAIDSLSVYRGLLQDNVLNKLNELLKCILSNNKEINKIIDKYNNFYYDLVTFNSTNTLKSYVINSIIFDDNVFSKTAEIKIFNDIDECIKNAVANDLVALQKVASVSAEDIKSYIKEPNLNWDYEIGLINSLPTWNFEEDKNSYDEVRIIFKELNEAEDWSSCISALASFHKENGTGIFARYKGFMWERRDMAGMLKGIKVPDPIRLCDLIKYDSEREIIIKNTISFLKGRAANNVLLYGDRGTGKSSTVKALLNEYYNEGLRVIELQRMYLTDFPEVVRILRSSPLKFIIFIDDLAFEDNEENYTSLKAVLEGGLESRPKNVVIYATSNRRHLIKETFSDREDEVHAADAMQEKLSLSDRFGITVTFLSPDQNKYLEIVKGIVENRGLTIDADKLRSEALRWEMKYNGRSPRTAKQFVDWLEGQLS